MNEKNVVKNYKARGNSHIFLHCKSKGDYKMKKKLVTMLCAAMCATLGLSFTASASDGDSLELAYNLTTEDFAVFESIINDFTAETGINVTIYNGGDDYESAMKTRMSSGDLPDMWVTHGWSLIRYSEYMMDLSDQDWVADIDSGLKDVITNDDGELFILPITQAVVGIVYNKDVLDAAGVDPTQIRTWDDFDAACQQVLDNTDAAPIEIVMGDAYDAYSLELIWPTLYTNSDLTDSQADALKDGSFDWTEDGREGFEMLASWFNKGYFNEDYVSGKKDDICKAMANGEGAFSLYSTEMIPSVLAYNADVNLGVLPLPASTEDGASSFGSGEGNFSCFGIWKDTTHEEECKQLLEYLAQPEIATQIVRIDGGIPALTTIELDDSEQAATTANAFKEAQAQFEGDLVYDNFFDREYLPSGMWSVMGDAVQVLLADQDPDSTIDEAIEMVADNYNDLMGN
jgi:raffinose/stachyose/melibiose transport system substrate-binding protein